MDDTDAIESAISAAATAGGGIVFLPRGTYKITRTLLIPADVTLQGVSNFRYGQGSILHYDPETAGAAVRIDPANNGIEARSAPRNLHIYTPSLSMATVGVDCGGCYSLDFEFVTVNGFFTGFLATESFYTTWRRCAVQGRHGGTGITSEGNFNQNVVNNCTFIGPATLTNGTLQRWTPISIQKNALSTAASTGSVIRDSDFAGGAASGTGADARYCIDLGPNCTGFHVSGNRLEANGIGFLRQADASFGLTIVGNELAGSDGNPISRGIEISGGGVEIGLNTWWNTTEAVRLTGTARRVRVSHQETPYRTSGAPLIVTDSQEDIELPDERWRFIASNLSTSTVTVKQGDNVRPISLTHYNLKTVGGDSGSFSIYRGLEVGVGYRFAATAGANCTVTPTSTAGEFAVVVGGDSLTYYLAFSVTGTELTLRASASASGNTELRAHVIPLT
ncbi:glycosyl hydrolase family 28-related protein [Longimicrobium sp.]|uniref:glycosyl hydrolase family 28-related protein n=1 Tax=Longimicrobium sp. TaxID=2029185 RepID=UPI003B3A356F